MKKTAVAHAALLLASTLVVFSGSASHEFISYDDPGYVTGNAVVRSGLNVRSAAWATSTLEMSNWHPLTWLSHMLDVELFGLAPAGHHLMSVVLHGLSAVVLYLSMLRLTGRPWRSLAVAALFALHPLHVESVAWVAERKDVLSGLLGHVTLLLYAGYVRKPSAVRYVATTIAFALGLLAKPMLVTLPVVLLILDGWPLGRLGRFGAAGWWARARALVLEKVPFFVLALASSAVTIYAQRRGGSLVGLGEASLGLRASNAALAYWGYLSQAFWPSDLAVLYPLPAAIPPGLAVGAAMALGLVTAGAWWQASRLPYVAAGWSWFLVTLLPVIGLIQVGAQSRADRYTYLPLTGVFIALVWATAEVAARIPRGRALTSALAAAVTVALAAATWRQLAVWSDSLTLYRHTLDVTSGNYLIMNNYGAALNEAGRSGEAIPVLEAAIALEPRHAPSYYNLGRIHHVVRRDYPLAAALYRQAIQLEPGYVDAEINLGGVLNKMDRFEEAAAVLERARGRVGPTRAELLFNLAVAQVGLAKVDAALAELETLRRLDPGLARQLERFVASRTAGPAPWSP